MTTSHSPHHFSPRPNRAHEIPWLEWGPEVFERAKAEDKPVLLGLSAVWCHWCHVMDETTYSDEAVIKMIKARFIPVRVDNDTRPDINTRYNMGGWPSTVVLDDEGEVLVGLTYIPPDRMIDLLTRVNEAWLIQRDDLKARIEEARERRIERSAAQPEVGTLTAEIAAHVRDTLDGAYDEVNGGFGTAPKFPQVDALRLLIAEHLRTDEEQPLERARFTLQQMASGGMYDRVEGGFFRYSTAADWSVPHFEKMSEDHGGLLLTLAELGRVSDAERDVATPIVEQTIAYLDRTLSMSAGGFAGSQDADETYFALDAAGRDALPTPYVDPRVYTSWTAGLARGYIACGVTFERFDWVERGRRAVDFLWQQMRAGEAGMYRYFEHGPHLLDMVADQSETLLALLDAYEVIGEPPYLDHAQHLARIVESRWRDPGRGFWDIAEGHDATGLLAVRTKSLSENADLAEAFLRLGRMSHDERYLRVAEETLADFAEPYLGYGTQAARYAYVVERFLTAEPEIQIVGGVEGSDAARRADGLQRRALQLPLAARTVQRLDPVNGGNLIWQLGLPPEREGVAYICVGTVCSEPVEHPDELESAISLTLAAPTY